MWRRSWPSATRNDPDGYLHPDRIRPQADDAGCGSWCPASQQCAASWWPSCTREFGQAADRADVEATLRLFGRVPIDDPVWELMGRVMEAMIRRGKKIKFPDAVIAATAIHRRIPLWTRDAHFTWVQSAFPELTLFDESRN